MQHARLPQRPSLSPVALTLAVGVWITFVANWAHWIQYTRVPELTDPLRALGFAAGGVIYQFAWVLFILALPTLLLPVRYVRYVLAALLLVAASTGYFVNFLGIQFDRSMLVNVLQTHPAEAMELISVRSVLWLLGVGVLPALAVLWVRLRERSGRLARLRELCVLVVLPVTVTLAVAYPQYQSFASARRNHVVHFNAPAPASLLVATLGHLRAQWRASRPHVALGLDAHPRHAEPKPRLLVLVLGETARSQNQQLSGYARATNPRMAALNHTVYFPETETCGTATAQSVPCIFSGLSRQDFTVERAEAQDNLLDILHRSGVDILWLDNDSGCKGVCIQHPTQDLTYATDARHCSGGSGECHDAVLLDALQKRLAQPVERDTLIVLHIKGSHGPAYYKRYPAEFERFKPACQTNELTRCDPEALVNAYDNTIVYTDHILGEVVTLLERQKQTAPVMFYVSDHGESLGEKGLYLHGLPYAVAPEYQTRVPMLAWISPTYQSLENWSPSCMAQIAKSGRRHEHVYHSLLGLFEVETGVYKSELDVFAGCEQPQHASLAKPPTKP